MAIVAPGAILEQKGHTMTEGPMHEERVGGGRALIRSIWSSGIRDITAEGLDILLDSALEEGLGQDIPIVGWLVKTYDVMHTVRDRLFLRKILRFLRGTQATTAEERHAFAERMEADPAYQRQVGEHLFLLLDRHETVDKSELLGRVFAALIRQEISYEEYQRYAFIIDRLFSRTCSTWSDITPASPPSKPPGNKATRPPSSSFSMSRQPKRYSATACSTLREPCSRQSTSAPTAGRR
jgi:hypothetical protein